MDNNKPARTMDTREPCAVCGVDNTKEAGRCQCCGHAPVKGLVPIANRP